MYPYSTIYATPVQIALNYIGLFEHLKIHIYIYIFLYTSKTHNIHAQQTWFKLVRLPWVICVSLFWFVSIQKYTTTYCVVSHFLPFHQVRPLKCGWILGFERRCGGCGSVCLVWFLGDKGWVRGWGWAHPKVDETEVRECMCLVYMLFYGGYASKYAKCLALLENRVFDDEPEPCSVLLTKSDIRHSQYNFKECGIFWYRWVVFGIFMYFVLGKIVGV